MVWRLKKYRCSRVRRKSSSRDPSSLETNESESIVDRANIPPGRVRAADFSSASRGRGRCSITSSMVTASYGSLSYAMKSPATAGKVYFLPIQSTANAL